FRIDAANALIANVPEIRDPIALRSLALSRLGKDVVDLIDASVSYGANEVLRDVNWKLAPGERTGILGINGAGKSTLLNLITRDVEPTSGRVKYGKTVQVATLTQGTDRLAKHLDQPVHKLIAELRTEFTFGDGSKSQSMTPAQLLEQLGFESAQLSTPIRDLSGGQKRRLQLLLVLLEQPNVLILDEPTNDLDTDMLTALEDLLDSWAGTLIVVSHDRYFLERVTDQQYAVLDKAMRHLPGGVDEYLALRAQQGSQATSVAPEKAKPAPTGLTGAKLHAARKEYASVERKLTRLRGEVTATESALTTHDPSDYVGLGELSAKITELHTSIDELEFRWLELSELLG
ncbi:MAG: ABC-F family ATP-binding cassette domain-containing protein, partial [Actinomycetales bacterium]|nr:ABC-F family ATP-binding cassette domain-containing protein [Actinomycetales bacterium]